MSWHAVESVDRAVYATRRFLFPFGAVRWAKLAFLALVMAGGGTALSGAGTSSVGASTGDSAPWAASASRTGSGPLTGAVPTGAESVPGSVEGALGAGAERIAGLDTALLVGVIVGALFAVAVLIACSIAFRLVFYDALATDAVRLWGPFRDRFRQALGLFAFAAAVAVVTGAPAVGLALALDPELLYILGVTVDGVPGPVSVPTALLGVLGVVTAGTALVGAVVSGFTFQFVAPAMVAQNAGVLAGWRAVWSAIRRSWREVVLYVVVHAVVATGIGIVQAIAVAFVGGVVAVFALIALVLTALALGGVGALVGTAAGAVALALVLVCAIVVVMAATLPVRLVVRTYLTAYEVSTLAGIAPDLALLSPTLVDRDESGPVDE